MPLTMENARRLLEQDHDVTEVTQGGNVMGGYLEARLTDGRAVQVDFHDNPAWKDTDRLAGRIEVSYANRPQAEWRYDDNDMAEREHTVIDPAAPDALQELGKAVEGWERAGGLRTARASETSHLAAQQPPEEYAYRWRNDPVSRHVGACSPKRHSRSFSGHRRESRIGFGVIHLFEHSRPDMPPCVHNTHSIPPVSAFCICPAPSIWQTTCGALDKTMDNCII